MTPQGDQQSRRAVRPGEWHWLAVLGLPTFGMALAITTVSTYLPVVAQRFTESTTVIGVFIGGEGMMALWLPILTGSWSDRIRTPIGSRLPFLLAGTPLMIAGLALLGVAGSLFVIGVGLALFFCGYFTAYEPYRALYPDLIEGAIAGRAQSTQAVWRGAGTGLALLGGGLLLSITVFLPFASAALLLAASVAGFSLLLMRELDPGRERRPGGGRGAAARAFARVRLLLAAHPAVRAYVVANALWELSLGGLKTFIVLFVTVGLGYDLGSAALIIGGVAVIVLGGALLTGELADRFGRLRVMYVGLWVYGISLLVPAFTTSTPLLIAAIPVIALGGGMIMSLPYALLMPLMPAGEHGALTGVYSVSRGFGTLLGPLLAGLAIQLLGPYFDATQGYAAMWLVISAAILVSLTMMRRLRAAESDRAELRRLAGSAAVQ